MNGPRWHEAYQAELDKRGLCSDSIPCNMTFREVGGRSKCTDNINWPVDIVGCNGEIQSAQCADDFPMLLGRPMLQSIGFHIHIGLQTADMDAVGVQGYSSDLRERLIWPLNSFTSPMKDILE